MRFRLPVACILACTFACTLACILAAVFSSGSAAASAFPVAGGEYAPVPPVSYGSSADLQSVPRIAADSSGAFLVWIDSRASGLLHSAVFGTRIGADGSALDRLGIALRSVGHYDELAIARGDECFLVVWSGREASGNAIQALRISPSGEPLDAQPLRLSLSPLRRESSPAVAWDGSNFLVVWAQEGGGLRGARVSGRGELLDFEGFRISPANGAAAEPDVVWNGSAYLVVWSDEPIGEDERILCARVSTSAQVLDPDGIQVAVGDYDRHPSVAWNGSGYLIAWQKSANQPARDPQPEAWKERNGWNDVPFRAAQPDTSSRAYIARVGADGIVADPNGRQVCTHASAQAEPVVTSDGTDFLVLWVDSRLGGLRTGSGGDVFAGRVLRDGTIADPDGLPIHTDQRWTSRSLTVAWDGRTYLAAWESDLSDVNADLLGCRIDRSGVVLDPEGLEWSTAADAQAFPAVAGRAADALLVYQDYRGRDAWDLYGTLLDAAGAPIAPGPFPIHADGGDQMGAAVATNGTAFLTVWQDDRDAETGGAPEIRAARVNAAGTVLDTAGIVIAPAARTSWARPSVAWNGTDYVVAWTGGSADPVRAARLSAGGLLRDPVAIEVSGLLNGIQPAVACAGAAALVAWTSVDPRAPGIYGRLVGPEGAFLSAVFEVSSTGQSPVATAGGGQFLIAWIEPVPSLGLRRVRATRVIAEGESAGRVLDPGGVLVSEYRSDRSDLSVAWDGTEYVIAHGYGAPEAGSIHLVAIGFDGSVRDTGRLTISAPQPDRSPAIAGLPGGKCIVAWTRAYGDPFGTERLVARAGSFAEVTPVLLSGLAAEASGPDVTLSWWAMPGAFREFLVERGAGDDFAPVGSTAGDGGDPGGGRRDWTDRVPQAGSYLYRVAGLRADGSIERIGPIGPVEVLVPEFRRALVLRAAGGFLPGGVALRLEGTGVGLPVTVRVFDPVGRAVCVLGPVRVDAGPVDLDWGGRRADGRVLPSGIYLFRAESAGVAPAVVRALLLR